VVGHTIGLGIFLTPGELIGAVASPGVILGLWLGCGALVLAGALTFGELASRYPLAGGPYVYLREAWGERIAFLYGWQSLLIMDPGVTAALATGVSGYVVVLWPVAAGHERSVAVATIWLLALVSMAGLTLSARVLTLMTALKVVAFGAIVVMAFSAGRGSWSHFAPFGARHVTVVPLGEALALGLVGVFFSFGGFWEASRIAGEVRDPRRTMPAALAVGVTVVTAVYVATTAAFIYLVAPQEATSATAFVERAGQAMFGGTGAATLASIVILSVIASALALVIMAPRLYTAMSSNGLFPAALANVNPVTHSPVRATMVLAALASVFVFIGTFQEIVAFFMCTTLGFVALAAAALFRLRRGADAGVFLSPGHPVTTLLFVLLVSAVVVVVALGRPIQAAAGLFIVLLGVPAYSAFARLRG
jgi:APA family basic amino acid/polyamine antiporter